jgi:hypothetical protein
MSRPAEQIPLPTRNYASHDTPKLRTDSCNAECTLAVRARFAYGDSPIRGAQNAVPTSHI